MPAARGCDGICRRRRSDYLGRSMWAPFFLLDARPPLGGGRRAGIYFLSIDILARAQALQFRSQLAHLCLLFQLETCLARKTA